MKDMSPLWGRVRCKAGSWPEFWFTLQSQRHSPAPSIEYAKCDVCNEVGNGARRKGEMNLMKYFAGGMLWRK
jgi:hypothetical protein